MMIRTLEGRGPFWHRWGEKCVISGRRLIADRGRVAGTSSIRIINR